MNIPQGQPHDIQSAGAILGISNPDETAVRIRVAIRALHGMIEQQSQQGISPVEVYRAEYELAEKIIDLFGDEWRARLSADEMMEIGERT